MQSHDALIGKWTATVTPDDTSKTNTKEFTDTVTFKGMKFTSQELQKQGFEPATYEENPSPLGAAAKFSVTLTNKDGDTAKWTGESMGVEMSGELTITRKDGTAISYTFKASRPG
jgi:hypothetical protein